MRIPPMAPGPLKTMGSTRVAYRASIPSSATWKRLELHGTDDLVAAMIVRLDDGVIPVVRRYALSDAASFDAASNRGNVKPVRVPRAKAYRAVSRWARS